MFARLLILTKAYQVAATQAVLLKRTVIRLSPEEWAELNDDEQFRRIYAGQSFV